jgi:anti-sigma B factor antagonist
MYEPGAPPTGSSEHPGPPRLFELKAAQENGAYVIRAKGELDGSERPRLERALAGAEASHATLILLDLDGLTFIDSAGLEALVAACHRSASNGDRLRLTRGRGAVARMFQLTRLDVALPLISVDGWPPVAETEQEASNVL